jgi:hypothetical protein
MMTGTRAKYSASGDGFFVHDWNTVHAIIVPGSFVEHHVFIEPGRGLDDNIYALLECKIDVLFGKAYEWIGKEYMKPYLEIFNQPLGTDLERDVVLYINSNRFGIDAFNRNNEGLVRGVILSSVNTL